MSLETETMLSEAGHLPLRPGAAVKRELAPIEKQRTDRAVIDGSFLREPVDVVAERLRAQGVSFVGVAGAMGDRSPEVAEATGAPNSLKPISAEELVKTMEKLRERSATEQWQRNA